MGLESKEWKEIMNKMAEKEHELALERLASIRRFWVAMHHGGKIKWCDNPSKHNFNIQAKE